MPRKYFGKSLPDKKFIYVRSETYSIADEPVRRFEVLVEYSEIDWKNLENEAQSLELEPEKFFEQRMKRAARPRVSVSRVEHAKDRLKLYDGYSDFWFPFVKYLTFAHLTVIAAGIAVEFTLGTGRTYIFFYWSYLGSLVLALIAWLGYRLDYLLHRTNHHQENEQTIRFEVLIARSSEKLMWISFSIFALSLFGRIALGLYEAIIFLKLPM